MKQQHLLEELKAKVNECLNLARSFKQLSLEELSYSPTKGSWNILQCLEHCNRYWAFYSKEFNRHLNESKNRENKKEFDPGFWGATFTKMMLPVEGQVKKMKTFKSKNPSPLEATIGSIEGYIKQQEELLDILEKAKAINLNQNKCKLTIPLVKMNYGSTLQFIIFHNVRHLQQAQKLVQNKA